MSGRFRVTNRARDLTPSATSESAHCLPTSMALTARWSRTFPDVIALAHPRGLISLYAHSARAPNKCKSPDRCRPVGLARCGSPGVRVRVASLDRGLWLSDHRGDWSSFHAPFDDRSRQESIDCETKSGAFAWMCVRDQYEEPMRDGDRFPQNRDHSNPRQTPPLNDPKQGLCVWERNLNLAAHRISMHGASPRTPSLIRIQTPILHI